LRRRTPRLTRAPVLTVGIALAAVAFAGAPSHAADRAAEGSAGSFGDLRFHASAVAFRHGPNEARADFTIKIPYREIKFLPDKDRFSAKLRLTVEMWNAAGKRAGYVQREAILQSTDLAATTDSLLGEIYTLGLAAPPGKYRYMVRVEDMNVARMGLVYKMKDQKRQGEVQGSVDMGPWLFRNPALSGVLFAWEIRPSSEGSPFTRGPYDVVPHPSAFYGQTQDAVSLYYELYDEPPPPEGRVRLVSASILNAVGDTLFTSIDSLRTTEGTAWPHALSIDVPSLPAGHYRLALAVLDDAGKSIADSHGRFDMLWSMDSWRPDVADFYEVTAATLLPTDSAEIFRTLPTGEKERWVEEIWRRADPTPETADNEYRNEFRRRVDYANVRYSVYDKGMFSDRGRIYIRYGDPDDVKIERVPVADRSLGYELRGEIPEASRRQVTDTSSGTMDDRPYEIWEYDMRGKELVPRFGANEISSGIKFVFVDEHGYGEYTLKYSSTSGAH
jgi:GWxTD domain-containing protein